MTKITKSLFEKRKCNLFHRGYSVYNLETYIRISYKSLLKKLYQKLKRHHLCTHIISSQKIFYEN